MKVGEIQQRQVWVGFKQYRNRESYISGRDLPLERMVYFDVEVTFYFVEHS